MKKPRPKLIPWNELTPEAQAHFRNSCHPTNYPENFDVVLFKEDGSGYRDTLLLVDIFNIESKIRRERGV